MRHATALASLLLPAYTVCLPDGDTDEVLPSVSARTTHEEYKRSENLPSDQELENRKAKIGAIHINPQHIFDTSDPAENTTLFRLGNRLHIMTRQQTIGSQLLFKTGDLYEGRLLQESERILRTTCYLRDAWVRPVAYHDGVVDVEVITRDVWTLNPSFSIGRTGGKNTSGFEIEDLNFLGRGQRLSLGRKSDLDRDSTVFRFQDRQLWGSWWSLDTQYSDNSDGKTEQFAVEHPFYSLDTRRAGGIDIKNDLRIDSLYDRGAVVDEFLAHEKTSTAYFGWSSGESDGWVRRWTVGFTADESRFDTVAGSALSTLTPADRKLHYSWVGFELLQDDFRTARNRDQIEKTEDVFLGWRAGLKLGYASAAFGANRSAVMFDAQLAKGFEFDARQTLLLDSSFVGRLEDGSFADTLASASARYYLRQSPRQLLFVALSADVGSNLDLDHPLHLGGDNGLRGYPLRYEGGEGRWLFTVEQRFFTNWYPFRLTNVGAAVFFDAGQAWGKMPLGASSQGTLKDIGVGLRLGNSRSALGNVLHIDVAFPLDGDRSLKNMQFLIETKRSF